jgi:uncharacterized protein YkwD
MKVLLLLLALSFTVQAVDRKAQMKIKKYFQIMRLCPDKSAVPAQILKELEKFDSSQKTYIIKELKKEFQQRGTALIYLYRKEAYVHSKKYLAENITDLKGKIAALKALGEISDENISEINQKLKQLMAAFIPANISWSDKVKTTRTLVAAISTSLHQIDNSTEMADMNTLEFIAKASVCPLLLKNPEVVSNYKKISSYPFQVSAAVFQINMLRVFRGKKALIIDPRLNIVAYLHAKDMKVNNYLSHESPPPASKTLQQRAAKYKTKASEEIIGRGTNDVLKLNWAYLKRTKNARHYFGPWKRIGVGYYSKYWTEIFGK